MNDEAVYRTAPATPGLLNSLPRFFLSARGGKKLKLSGMSINHTILILVGRHFKMSTSSRIFILMYLFKHDKYANLFPREVPNARSEEYFFISSGDFFPWMSSTFKHNSVVI